MNNKLYALIVVTCFDGVLSTETALFTDLIDAKIRFSEEYKYQMQQAPDAAAYDGYDSKNILWFEVGETSQKYWAQAVINEVSINC